MKILDENGRIGGKISIVDVIVVLLCLLMVIAVVLKYSDNDTRKKSMEAKEITYTVRIERIRQCSVDSVRKGDHFVESVNKNDVGEVVGIDVQPATSLMEIDDGSMVDAPIQDRYDMVLTLKTNAEIHGGHVYLNHTDELSVNGSLTLLSKYIHFTGQVTGINK